MQVKPKGLKPQFLISSCVKALAVTRWQISDAHQRNISTVMKRAAHPSVITQEIWGERTPSAGLQ
jgi:hypothetical protein